MKKFVFYLTALFLFGFVLPGLAYSQQCDFVDDIASFPTQPSTQDSITILVRGRFSYGCWQRATLDSFRIAGDTVYVHSSARDFWPQIPCIQVVINYQIQVNVGLLPAGNYSIVSLMEVNSLRYPMPVASCSSNLAVQGSSPCVFNRGDMNNDAVYSPADVVLLLSCVFTNSGNCHACFADVNCDGELTPADVVLELNRVFLEQSFPC